MSDIIVIENRLSYSVFFQYLKGYYVDLKMEILLIYIK